MNHVLDALFALAVSRSEPNVARRLLARSLDTLRRETEGLSDPVLDGAELWRGLNHHAQEGDLRGVRIAVDRLLALVEQGAERAGVPFEAAASLALGAEIGGA